jgi:hypothetical protein
MFANKTQRKVFPMTNSILQFLQNGMENIEKHEEKFLKNPADIASYVYGIQEETNRLAQSILKETLEFIDQTIRNDSHRVESWYIVRKDVKQLVTTLGEVTFHKTLFKNKETGQSEYLLDRILEMDSHERMTEDAQAKLLEEAVQTSYRRAGEEISMTGSVSRQTVKNKIHSLEFPEPATPLKKKTVDYLYIDADEDHVHLQFRETKGDLETGGNHRKNNCVLAKLVYVYEGIEKEAPKSKRHRLVNPHYFSGVYDGEKNRELWDEVYHYLDTHYELDKVKKIYLNADGGSWIQAGKKGIAGITTVLDEFHINKYLLKATSHMLDSAQDARDEMKDAIKNKTKKEFAEIMKRIKNSADSENCLKRICESERYILSNWTAAKVRMNHRNNIKGCSAEGHVSHVLSDRMSSRPMGWSRQGCDKMSQLRAYYYNHESMLELVRLQKKEMPKAAGTESDYKVISAAKMTVSERQTRNDTGKYYDAIQANLAAGIIKKQAYLKGKIWGL